MGLVPRHTESNFRGYLFSRMAIDSRKYAKHKTYTVYTALCMFFPPRYTCSLQEMLRDGQGRARELTTTIEKWQLIRHSTISNCEEAVGKLRDIWEHAYQMRCSFYLAFTQLFEANVYDKSRSKDVMDDTTKRITKDRDETSKVITKFSALHGICEELQQCHWNDLTTEEIFVYILRNKDSVTLTEASIDQLCERVGIANNAVFITSVGLVCAFQRFVNSRNEWAGDKLERAITFLDNVFRVAGGAAKKAIEVLEVILPELKKGERNITGILEIATS